MPPEYKPVREICPGRAFVVLLSPVSLLENSNLRNLESTDI